MSLLLTRTSDQAFVAAVVQEAWRHTKKRKSGYLGRTALQKIVYFMQVLSAPIGYRFTIHHFGPFCDEIVKDVEMMEVDEVVKDQRRRGSRYSNFVPGPALDELLDLHREVIKKHRPLIAEAVEALIPLEPRRLELLATMHYAYRHVRAAGGKGPWRTRTIEQFREFKDDKFSDDEIASSYDGLVRAKLVEE